MPEHTKRAEQLMARRGMAPIVLSRRVELSSQAAWLFSTYLEIDRDGFSGRPLFAGMNAVLDEFGVTDKEERKRIRAIWRSMHTVEREVHEQQAEKQKELDEAKHQRPRPGRGAGRGASRGREATEREHG